MIAFENGVLSIKYGFSSFAKTLYDILFILNTVSIFVFNKVESISPMFSVALFASSLLILVTKKNGSIVIPTNTVWFGTVILFILLSCSWSKYFEVKYFETIIKMVIILLTITSISIYVDTADDIEKLMSGFILSAIFVVVFELVNTPVDLWTAGQLGSYSTGSNANAVSFYIFCAELFAFHKAYGKGQKIYYPLVVIFFVFMLFSSSRKALFLGLLAPLLTVLMTTEKRGYAFRIMLFVTIGIFVVYLVMTNETLYNVLGQRIQRLITFATEDTGDNSMRLRAKYIEIAKEMFVGSPIIGQGFRSFTREVGSKSYVYCHNNYWQLLSEYGLVGFMIYYSMYIYCIYKLAKSFFRSKSSISLTFLIFFVLLMIFEVGIVSVTAKYQQLVIAMAFAATYLPEEDSRKYQYLDTANMLKKAI